MNNANGDQWSQWDEFLKTAPDSGFMQSSWWADFRKSAGYNYFGSILRSSGRIVGGALVMKFSHTAGQCFYYIPEGPLLPPHDMLADEAMRAILADIDDRRKADEMTVSHLRIEPRVHRLTKAMQQFTPIPPFRDRFMEPRSTICIDLRPPEAAILAQMKPKGRYNIRLAEKHGVSIVEDTTTQGVEDFVRIYESTAERKGMNAKPREYFEELIPTLFSGSHGSVFFAEYYGIRLATAIVVFHGNRATYFFGASSSEERHVMAPYLLHFEIMRKAKSLGCEWYDLWGVAPIDRPDHPWSDISVFKRKFGGVEITLVPTLDLVYDAEAYALYRNQEEDAAGPTSEPEVTESHR